MLWMIGARHEYGPAIDGGSGNQPPVPRAESATGPDPGAFRGRIVVLLGFTAIVIDVSWYWANTLRLQRAADAAALAGAVQLPGNVQLGQQLSVAEAQRNGYTQQFSNNCIPGTTPYICAVQDANPHQMDVTMTAQVQTFFMRLFGINSLQAHVTSEAQFTLPVPWAAPTSTTATSGRSATRPPSPGPSAATDHSRRTAGPALPTNEHDPT